MNFEKALIVDDKESEIEELKKYLEKQKIYVEYHNPNNDGLIENKNFSNKNFDLIFLDLQYVTGTDSKNTADIAFSELESLVGNYNDPYFLIIWSGQKEELKNFFLDRIKLWNSDKMKPFIVLDFDKTEFLKLDKKNVHSFLANEFKNKIDSNDGAFLLIKEWNKIIRLSSYNMLKKIISFDLIGNNITLLNIFDNLAKEIWRNSNIYDNDLRSFKNLFLAFSELFNCYIVEEIANFSEKIQISSNIKQEKINDTEKEKINRFIKNILIMNDSAKHLDLLGSVYKISDDHKIALFNKKTKEIQENFILKYEIIKSIISSKNKKQKEISNSDFGNYLDEEKLIPIHIDISKDCDFASSREIKKIVMGLLVTTNISKEDFCLKSSDIKGWEIGDILYNNKIYKMYISPLFTYSYLKNDIPNEELYMFHLRKPYLLKIKHIIFSYMLNPGIINLE